MLPQVYFMTASCMGVVYIIPNSLLYCYVIVVQLPGYPAQCQIVASQGFVWSCKVEVSN